MTFRRCLLHRPQSASVIFRLENEIIRDIFQQPEVVTQAAGTEATSPSTRSGTFRAAFAGRNEVSAVEVTADAIYKHRGFTGQTDRSSDTYISCTKVPRAAVVATRLAARESDRLHLTVSFQNRDFHAPLEPRIYRFRRRYRVGAILLLALQPADLRRGCHRAN